MNDVIPKGTRHFATYNRASVMVLGFHAATNNVFVVNLEQLPYDEANELVRLAMSPVAQKSDTMATLLANQTHSKSGKNWLEIIWGNKGNRWVGSTFPDNLSDMNQDQKNFFKGFGRTLDESVVATEEQAEKNHSFRSQTQPLLSDPVPVSPIALEEAKIFQNEAPVQATGNTEVVEMLRKQNEDLMKTLMSQQITIDRLTKKVPVKSKPGPKPGTKPKIVTGRPTPAAVFEPILVETPPQA